MVNESFEIEGLKKYKSITGDKNTKQEYDSLDLDRGESVLLFFSYDITNSSLYKSLNYYGWSIVIDYILSVIRNNVENGIPDAELWRVMGDEVIFIVKIRDVNNLLDYVDEIYSILIDICKDIETGVIFKQLERQFNNGIKIIEKQNIISLKGTAWIAKVTQKNLINNERLLTNDIDNIYEVIEQKTYSKFHEFIGVDIDAGFRLSKETRTGRLAVSFELAYLMMIHNSNEIIRMLNIITYRKLKGVWQNGSYPIIWYYNPSFHDNIPFKDSLPFDAVEQDEIYAEYLGNKKFDEYMYNDVCKALKKICKDKELAAKIERLRRTIETTPFVRNRLFDSSKLELHCVAVCFNQNGEILCVQRSEHVSFMPGKWEFGCAKANYEEQLIETIKGEYKRDFNIEIEIPFDQERSDTQPIPIAIYSVIKENEIHKGLIFIAKIVSGEIKLKGEKHIKYMFVRKDQLAQFDFGNFVPDGIDTMKKAFSIYETIEKKGVSS